MFRFFPLNLDWNSRSSEKKCGKEALKLNEETINKDFFHKIFQMLKKIHQSQESQPEKLSKNLNLTVSVDWRLNSDFSTHIIAYKSAKKPKKKSALIKPHATEVQGEGVETSSGNSIQISRSEKLKTEINYWIG